MSMAKSANSTIIIDRPQRRGATSYDGELANIRLRESLAREEDLHRQIDALLQRQGVYDNLLSSQAEAAKRLAALTVRERQVMELILTGQLNKNIAADLGISLRTVENHRAAILRKAGSRSLPALARLALAAGWKPSTAAIGRMPVQASRSEPSIVLDHPSIRNAFNPSRGEFKS